jgi:hypothetical protein
MEAEWFHEATLARTEGPDSLTTTMLLRELPPACFAPLRRFSCASAGRAIA